MSLFAKIGAALLAACSSARPQPARRSPARLDAVTEKFNAYVEFFNRTLRASESIDRYKSWVNWATGPSGRERIVYGLCDVYGAAPAAARSPGSSTTTI
jgi:hypothetical protein